MREYVHDDKKNNLGVNCSFKNVVLHAQFLFITTQTHIFQHKAVLTGSLLFWFGPSRGINTPCMMLLEQDAASLSLSLSLSLICISQT